MSFTRLIQKQVRKSFKTVKDLAVDVTLIRTDAVGFSFKDTALQPTDSISAKPAVVVSPPIIIKGILGEVRKSLNPLEISSTSIKKSLLINREDASNLDFYDKVSINGETWNIIPPNDDNGFTVEVTISKQLG